MPGIRYTGLAAKFNDVWFAWRFLGTIVLVLFLFSLWLIASSDEVPGQNRVKVALREGGASSHMDPLEKSVINRFDPVPIRELTACTAREIPWTEFVKHSCATEDLWLVIGGHVYDVWPWGSSAILTLMTAMTSHPGGQIICNGAGADSTDIFGSIHPDYVRGMLEERCIGKIVGMP